jgi:hypothetical protein
MSQTGIANVSGTGQTINATQVMGNTTGAAPAAGFLGEQIRSYVSAQSIITATPTNVTSISLTPGVWDISANFSANNGGTGVITFAAAAATTGSATFTGANLGDNYAEYSSTNATNFFIFVEIPAFRALVTTTTLYNLVGEMTAASGTLTVSARISATRVG